MTRIVIVSHSHPALHYGGGEIAAYRQFQYLLSQGEDAWFVGSSLGPDASERFFGADQRILSVSERDFCIRGMGMDSFSMEHPRIENEDWTLEFLSALDGDVYHFHHFWNIGAGTIRRLRAARPKARMICTLHEMTAICAKHGQMVKTSGELCYAASDLDCAACLNRPPVDFALRRARMVEMLDAFDVLLSPSQFLADRFNAWGVAPGRIAVVENGLDRREPLPQATDEALQQRSRRFAFFGQATPTKGLNVLVRAAQIIDARTEPLSVPITLEVYGVTAEAFALLWPGLTPPEWMQFRGRYRPQDSVSIMQRFGWVIVPSIWWENSPLVIQEARAAGTPVIASAIGGMAEKTKGWGLSFPVEDPVALAATMLSVHDQPDILADHIARIKPPLDMRDYTEAVTKITTERAAHALR
jgi:glycosyltransferase involved in cell wall biosynthesis